MAHRYHHSDIAAGIKDSLYKVTEECGLEFEGAEFHEYPNTSFVAFTMPDTKQRFVAMISEATPEDNE